jgi:hypothetical protein
MINWRLLESVRLLTEPIGSRAVTGVSARLPTVVGCGLNLSVDQADPAEALLVEAAVDDRDRAVGGDGELAHEQALQAAVVAQLGIACSGHDAV